MRLDRDNTLFSCNGEVLGRAPRCPGVYRFYSAENVLLYIGKSIDIGTRLNSHFTGARDPGRQQRMMTAVHRVDCELSAGEDGALLIENAAIKAEAPLYNRRQRRSHTLWTQRLQRDAEGFLQVVASDFCPVGERIESVFGLFRSRTHISDSLRTLAREHGLCLRRLGAERGRGACFQRQVGRCRGACIGDETPAAHNARLLAALERQRIAAWPFAGPVILREDCGEQLHPAQPQRQFHLLHHWSYLGSFATPAAARRAADTAGELVFDRDTYRIALRALRRGKCALLGADAMTVIGNPFRGSDGDGAIDAGGEWPDADPPSQ